MTDQLARVEDKEINITIHIRIWPVVLAAYLGTSLAFATIALIALVTG